MLLTQQQIADYLGVTRSFVGAVEAEIKTLPTEKLIKLSTLYKQFKQNNTDKVEQDIVEQQNKLIAFLQKQHIKQQHRKRKLQEKLTDIQNHYSKALQLLQTVRSIQASNKQDVLWLQLIDAIAKEILEKNGLVEQKKLEILISKI